MAGPFTGTWRAKSTQGSYVGASKWGTGFNPVHRIPDAGPRRGPGKVVIDPIATPGGDTTTELIAEDQMWDFTSANFDPTLPEYDVTPDQLWGANTETGTANRDVTGMEQSKEFSNQQGWGLPNPDYDARQIPSDSRAQTQNSTRDGYPPWGGSRKPRPSGWGIRSIRRGSQMTQSARVLPGEDVAQGWTNKNHGVPADSKPADDSQVFVQTSAVQRYKTRAGSQRSGSQSTFDTPIESRVTGQKLKTFTREDSARHWEMLPYEQQDYVRPFLGRQVGTGYQSWALVNEMYVSPALQREPPPDPSMGTVVTGAISNPDASVTSNYGYSGEDFGAYY